MTEYLPASNMKKWAKRIGYGIGDLGCNLVFSTMASYLMVFYTDVFGITAAAAGTKMLVTKFIDALTDTGMGLIAAFQGFFVKGGMGLTSFIIGIFLKKGGYVANAVQISRALTHIEICFIWIPIVLCVLIAVLTYFYKLDSIRGEMTEELEKRR